ncbi:MAG: hypothetical protein JWQ88_854 [Rhodoferax sp.]|nr:hypothetical protein [Rhodoferax sp.]
MNATRIVAMVLVIGGVVGFFTGGFSFTHETTAARIGPVAFTFQEQESVNIPQWLSIGVAVIGAVLLVRASRHS